MINFNVLKWSTVFALGCGLSACYFDSPNYNQSTYNPENGVPYEQFPNSKVKAKGNHSGEPAATNKKSYTAKEVVQKSAPGPKRTAAPQLPVIQ